MGCFHTLNEDHLLFLVTMGWESHLRFHTLNEAHLLFLIPAGYEALLMSCAGSCWLVQEHRWPRHPSTSYRLW